MIVATIPWIGICSEIYSEVLLRCGHGLKDFSFGPFFCGLRSRGAGGYDKRSKRKEADMRFAVGYDRDLARQFFLNILRELAPYGRFSNERLSNEHLRPEEFDYVAERLTETACFPFDPERIGCPWPIIDFSWLLGIAPLTDSERVMREAELVANFLLLRAGAVTHGGLAERRGTPRRRTVPTKEYQVHAAQTLYRCAARRERLKESERWVLMRLARNAEPWVEVLSLLPNSDIFKALVEARGEWEQALASRLVLLPWEA